MECKASRSAAEESSVCTAAAAAARCVCGAASLCWRAVWSAVDVGRGGIAVAVTFPPFRLGALLTTSFSSLLLFRSGGKTFRFPLTTLPTVLPILPLVPVAGFAGRTEAVPPAPGPACAVVSAIAGLEAVVLEAAVVVRLLLLVGCGGAPVSLASRVG